MIKKMKGPQQQTMESIECYLNDENKYYKAKLNPSIQIEICKFHADRKLKVMFY